MTKEKTNHKENGDFSENNEYSFDSDDGEKSASEHSWSNKRKENLKRLGLWEQVKEDSDDE
jgi:hypothetical protein